MKELFDTVSPGPESKVLYGAVAIRLGFTSSDRIREGLGLQERMKRLGITSRPLGEILLAKGYLTDSQRMEVTRQQAHSLAFPSIPGYRILGMVGKGSIGSVWKALQSSMDRIVAIKGLAPERAQDPRFRERFLQEARAVARLSHPHIVQGYDVAVADGRHYLVMEYIDGPTVGQMIRRLGPMEEKRALRIMAQIASALHHARRRRIIHRDIKPENIMLTRKGVAKLCDLGLATFADLGKDPQIAGRAPFQGTPHYISPEQARGERSVDTRSDIYSLGATFYHMMTGEVPYPGSSPAAVVSKHLRAPVPDPRRANPLISPSTASAILRMMEKSPEKRYQTPKELFRDLQRIRSL